MLANTLRITRPTRGRPLSIGNHFRAQSFREDQFGGAMDPLLMVDHFRMTEPTFGLHHHAGFSAVTYVFEDSRSAHQNTDSMGNNLPINPGSLHWMAAGRGVLHDEWPVGEEPETHGLQLFVNLPREKRYAEPYAIHLESADVPVYAAEGVRVRVVAGELKGVRSPVELPQPFSIFDGFLIAKANLEIPVPQGWNAWIYAVEGQIEISVCDETSLLEQGHAIALEGFGDAGSACIASGTASHFIMLAGLPVES